MYLIMSLIVFLMGPIFQDYEIECLDWRKLVLPNNIHKHGHILYIFALEISFLVYDLFFFPSVTGALL